MASRERPPYTITASLPPVYQGPYPPPDQGPYPPPGHQGPYPLPPSYSEAVSPRATPPPSYSVAVTPPSAPPPSYNESVYGRLQRARDESQDKGELCKKILQIICCGTFVLIVIVGLMLGVPVAQIVIGSIHLNHCPIDRRIPIFNIVSGVLGIINGVLTCALKLCCGKRSDSEDDPTTTSDDDAEDDDSAFSKLVKTVNALFGCFALPWMIAASIWVYSIYDEVVYDDPSSSNFCQRDLYLFSFWILTTVYILIGIFCLCSTLVGFYVVKFSFKTEPQSS